MKTKLASLLIALALATAALVPSVPRPAAAAPDQAFIYLVALEDNGRSGRLIACGDSLVPVPVDIGSATTTEARITAVLTKLFTIHDRTYGQSGLYNPLYLANLKVDRVYLDSYLAATDRAVVHMSGTMMSAGDCDGWRILEQVRATVLQFPGLNRATLVITGDLLDFIVSLRGDHPGYRFFPETDHLVGHGILRYWEQFGGLAVFGYPLTEEVPGSNGGTVQYFERARFEWQPGALPERYDVLLGRVGAEVLGR